MIYDVIVVGGGASGCMASIVAKSRGANVLLLERNEKIGKKIYITGKGRCNVTNNSDFSVHLDNIINGKKFMNSASRTFNSSDCMAFFENNGVKLKTERGNRVFPESDKSSDIIKALEKSLKGVEVLFNKTVEKASKVNELFYIKCKDKTEYTSYCVIMAMGGKSYSATGSDGKGYKLCQQLGHSITDIKAGLVPIILNENVKQLEGLSLKNVEASVEINGLIVAKEFGEMLFTDNGVSGPIILTISSKINHLDLSNAKLLIDFKPSLDKQTLDNKLQREFSLYSQKSLSTYLKTIFLNKLVIPFMSKINIEDKKLALIGKEDRKKIIDNIKRFDFSVKMLDNIDNAIITSGGVNLDEINPKTMESKLCSNLYLVGEMIDVDALTGGFNLQVAFSTGYVAGLNCRWS